MLLINGLQRVSFVCLCLQAHLSKNVSIADLNSLLGANSDLHLQMSSQHINSEIAVWQNRAMGTFSPSQRAQVIWKESNGFAQAQSGAFGGLKGRFDSDLASLQTHSFGVLWVKAVGAQKADLKAQLGPAVCRDTECAGVCRIVEENLSVLQGPVCSAIVVKAVSGFWGQFYFS